MLRWIPYAFVRIVIFFCLGILLALYDPDLLKEHFSIPLLGGLSCCYLIFTFFKRSWKINPGSIGLFAISLTGYVAVQLKTESRSSDHVIHLKEQVEFYSVVVTSQAQEKEKTWKLEAVIQSVKTSEWIEKEGRILLYVSKQASATPFRYGDVLVIKGHPELVRGPPNPGEFDYRRFLSFKQIYHQAFLREGNVICIGNLPPSKFIYYALSARNWADGLLRKFITGEREQGLASALVLGVTDGLDNELLNAYAATGAMHILSVSGLHVGIIYWMVILLFKPFEKLAATKWILCIVSLLVLWCYAFVTGISPSVLRAVTMFSFVAIARPWNWRTNIYNSLAASAFFLLLYDPFMIMSVGFQLSYLAVVGIVALQPGLYRLWEPDNRWIDEIWKVSSVSIAAQLATFSLGLLYFHQFPNYFLFANLVVIPGSFVILIGGVLMMTVSFLEPVANVLGWILTWTMKLMNEFVFFVEKVPFSLIEGVQINSMQCLCLLMCIVLGYCWVETKRVKWLYSGAGLLIVYAALQWYHFHEEVAIKKLTVYNIPGHTAIDFSSHGKAFVLADSVMMIDQSKVRFHMLPNRIRAGVKEVSDCNTFESHLEGCSLLAWGGKTILQIREENFSWPEGTAIDFLIISNNAVKDLAPLVAMVKAKQIILDSSNTYRNAEKVVQHARELNREVFSVLHQGAFEVTF